MAALLGLIACTDADAGTRRDACADTARWVVVGGPLAVGPLGDLRVFSMTDRVRELRLEPLETIEPTRDDVEWRIKGPKRLRAGRLQARHAATGARLKARISSGCETLRGTLIVGARRTAFEAQPSRCGDGSVDAAIGERCDAASGCADGDCVACRCHDRSLCDVGPGPIDAGFGAGGIVVDEVTGDFPHVEHLAIQSTGAVVLAVSTSAFNLVLRRFTEGGVSDDAFAVSELGIHAKRMLILPDDRILLAGYLLTEGVGVLVGLNADGSRDDGFGIGGLVRIPLDGTRGVVTDLHREPDGALLVAGVVDGGLMLARLDAGGNFDPAFGEDGVILGALSESGSGAVLLDSAQVMIAQTPGTGLLNLRRFGLDAMLDETFGDEGLLQTSPGTYLPVYVTGFRLLRNGVAQLRWHQNGVDWAPPPHGIPPSDHCVWVAPTATALPACPVAVLAEDDAGRMYGADRCLHRHVADGTLDASFGTRGAVQFPGTPCGGRLEQWPDLTVAAVDATGRVVAAGTLPASCGSGNVVVGRWLP
ncbi:MAG TPA: hypothetical protein VGR62_05900 [Candidatus Binatia bacterium]|jgi:uncharacterized delta-60 repeat protein|nr:hypothetical protein [Candidatus Binatia bacterium]